VGARILVVEDNEANQDLFAFILRYAGYAVDVASDGVQGMDAMRNAKPDLVLCDVQMPVLDGYQVLEQVRADTALRDITIVALTAYSMPDDREKVVSAGFDGYITKPIEVERFVAQIEEYLPIELRTDPALRPARR
jgi:CheY-like chemotaxis protein